MKISELRDVINEQRAAIDPVLNLHPSVSNSVLNGLFSTAKSLAPEDIRPLFESAEAIIQGPFQGRAAEGVKFIRFAAEQDEYKDLDVTSLLQDENAPLLAEMLHNYDSEAFPAAGSETEIEVTDENLTQEQATPTFEDGVPNLQLATDPRMVAYVEARLVQDNMIPEGVEHTSLYAQSFLTAMENSPTYHDYFEGKTAEQMQDRLMTDDFWNITLDNISRDRYEEFKTEDVNAVYVQKLETYTPDTPDQGDTRLTAGSAGTVVDTGLADGFNENSGITVESAYQMALAASRVGAGADGADPEDHLDLEDGIRIGMFADRQIRTALDDQIANLEENRDSLEGPELEQLETLIATRDMIDNHFDGKDAYAMGFLKWASIHPDYRDTNVLEFLQGRDLYGAAEAYKEANPLGTWIEQAQKSGMALFQANVDLGEMFQGILPDMNMESVGTLIQSFLSMVMPFLAPLFGAIRQGVSSITGQNGDQPDAETPDTSQEQERSSEPSPTGQEGSAPIVAAR